MECNEKKIAIWIIIITLVSYLTFEALESFFYGSIH
jgi:hypothetical protein